jgi:hypothetical protein
MSISTIFLVLIIQNQSPEGIMITPEHRAMEWGQTEGEEQEGLPLRMEEQCR